MDIPEVTHTDQPLFLGWHDPDKKTRPIAKMMAACGRFAEKFGEPARYCLCSVADARAIGEQFNGVQVLPRTYVSVNVFYVGKNPPAQGGMR